jgi:beta-lactamase class A
MSGKHARPHRWLAVAGTVLLVLALVAVVLAVIREMNGPTSAAGTSSQVSSQAPQTTPAPPSTPRPRPTTSRPSPTHTHVPAVTPRATVDRAVDELSEQRPDDGVSVAVVNTRTHARYTHGATSGMRTGSCYKLLVLETLLLQRQDAGAQLSDSDTALATPMIENSDNVAAYQLFLRVGGRDGLADGAERLGLANVVIGQADPTLTTTSAQDYLALLADLVPSGKTGPLDQYSRSTAVGLMEHVESDQRWGIGVVADPGTTFANKNGWLSVDNSNDPSENDNGLWLVNSVGIVTVHHEQLLVAVFTQHGPSYEDGVELVEALVKAIVPGRGCPITTADRDAHPAGPVLRGRYRAGRGDRER